ncbi:uroporphyrinogen III methyltransferase/synthase [Metabacillus crassostreae]|uniref:uroporphyrinogen-III C-methyltransferase n=1 Tax=Metabacillus crassostreae TaxID=929098 RepID=UPI001EF8F62A|nr:uroporphyrinogen-III C-methyltransferase [Metabacillus crassostreae]MBM7605213.1 uroporphyrinogen III methyltransferase/synthase [Metabacillus crassostreae]
MGKVYLVGAGPGDSELITVKGLETIKKADVILYDRLVNPAILDHVPLNCELIYCGKLPTRHFMKQEEINTVLVEKALAGFTVVRLKGGDPSVFGRVGEEAEVLAENNIPYEIVPGITSGIAAPLYAGIPVTHRDYAGSFAIVTAHDKSKNGKPDIDWEGLSRGVQTIAFYMGISNLEHICENLILHGKPADTPVAIIRWGTWSRQQTVVGTLSTIVKMVRDQKIENPAITLVGQIIETREKVKWFEDKPFFGQQILYVRGNLDRESSVKELTDLGADVIEFPKWKLNEATVNNDDRNNLLQAEKLLFTTTLSVTYFLKLLRKEKIDIRQIKAAFYSRNKHIQDLLEEHGLLAFLEDELINKEGCLVIGSTQMELHDTEQHLGVYDYYADTRFESIITRAISDASINSVMLDSKEAVHLLMKKSAKYQIENLLEASILVNCLTEDALEVAKAYGLNANLLNEIAPPVFTDLNQGKGSKVIELTY